MANLTSEDEQVIFDVLNSLSVMGETQRILCDYISDENDQYSDEYLDSLNRGCLSITEEAYRKLRAVAKTF